MSNDILEHYGVKGMKWGVRRKRGANGRVGKAGKAKKERTPEEQRRREVRIGVAKALGQSVAILAISHYGAAKINEAFTGEKPALDKAVLAGKGALQKTLSSHGHARASDAVRATPPRVSRPSTRTSMRGASPSQHRMAADRHREAAARASVKRTQARKVSDSATASAASDLAKLKAAHAKTVREANASLKASYDKTQTPFGERSYLDEVYEL